MVFVALNKFEFFIPLRSQTDLITDKNVIHKVVELIDGNFMIFIEKSAFQLIIAESRENKLNIKRIWD